MAPTVDPYQMPGRFRIAKELDMLYSILKKTLENHFIQVKEFFMC